ncbi:MAG: glycosyltransferase family A protein [Thermoplasmata archaeon]
MDVLVRTFNSAATLEECLASVRARFPVERLLVIDRDSTDATREIASRFGAEVHTEDVGIGRATRLALAAASTDRVLFLDSDVTLCRSDFAVAALGAMRDPRVGAVVGTAIGHRFFYGLPLGLTVLPRAWARGIEMPDGAQGAETYYLRRALAREGLRVAYVPEAMRHRGTYRGGDWPEWQGAQVRIAAGWSLAELSNSLSVILLLHMNSRRAVDLAYTPVFVAKFFRGFLRPERWRLRDRRRAGPTSA